MEVLRRIWVVLLGTVVGIILGIIFDWLSQNTPIPVPTDGNYIVYPWIAGAGAFFGALVAALVLKPAGTAKGQLDKPAPRAAKMKKTAAASPSAKRADAARGGSEIKSSRLDEIKLDPVAGMPTFDFDESQKSPPAEPMPEDKP